MFCPKCGSEIADGAKFCPSCGTKVALADAPASKAPAGNVARKEPSGSATSDASSSNATRRKIPIPAIVAVVALVIGAVLMILHPWDGMGGGSDQGTWLLTGITTGRYTDDECEEFNSGNSYEYERDSSGRVVTRVENYEWGESLSLRVVYPEDGMQCVDFEAAEGFPNDEYPNYQPGTPFSRWIYETLSDGRVSDLELLYYGIDQNGNVQTIGDDRIFDIALSYDESGMLRSYSQVESSGYGYAAEFNGLLMSSYTQYFWDEGPWSLTWSYDSETHPTHAYLTDEDDGHTLEYEILYDDNGNVSEIRGIGGGAEGLFVRFEYERYDNPDPITRIDYEIQGVYPVIFWSLFA